MVKFSRELEAQLIPEWKDAFLDYRMLKKLIKRMKIAAVCGGVPPVDENDDELPLQPHGGAADRRYGFSVLDPLRSLAGVIARRFCPPPATSKDAAVVGDEESYESDRAVPSNDGEVKVFMEKLEEELEKIDKFFTAMETEFCERGEALIKQTHILTEVKDVLRSHCLARQSSSGRGSSNSGSLSRLNSNSSSLSESGSEVDEMIEVLERHGSNVSGNKKKGGRPRAAVRIDIPPSTPTRSVSAVGSMIWEDLLKGYRNGGTASPGSNGSPISRKKIQCAEKMIRNAFVELYRGLDLLKTYSSLNMTGFIKILKKFDKVANRPRLAGDFLKKVKSSHFGSSAKIMKLADEVEIIFTESFAEKDRKKAMKFLKPRQPNKDSHMVTFLSGLFTGSFVTLFTVYAILAHFSGIFSSSNTYGYVQIIYPVFSMFAFLSLHIYGYGCNLFSWKATRINHNFIFEFSPNTALKHRDAFLLGSSLMTTVVTALVVQLVVASTITAARHTDALPGTLLVIFIGVLFCPLDIFYRSTRYCFLRVIRNIVLSPFYKVHMVDFFMADQLCSQIQLLKHLEFTTCFFVAGLIGEDQYGTCSNNHAFRLVSYAISFMPYYWRVMQCFRRYFEEGLDSKHLMNAGKYGSAMVAAAFRLMYAASPTTPWLVFLCLSYTIATTYQLYWDFVHDWGLLDRKSKNRWLRDDLILKNKNIYFISMGVNCVLRLAWIAGVVHYNLNFVEHRMVDFLLACAEIIRRAHWNFYRLENEHLNNCGKFRAVRTVPLPFRELESD